MGKGSSLPKGTIPNDRMRLYFSDGKKSIDYVLVYSRKKLKRNFQINQLETFIQNLQKIGFDYESRNFSRDPDVRFVLLHLKEEILLDYATSYKIDLTMNSVLYKFRKLLFPFSKTFLTDPDRFDDLYYRAEETFKGEKPSTLTKSEIIYMITEILKKTRYGEQVSMYGLHGLIKQNTVMAGYPIHDGQYKWTNVGYLNDRQLLYEYWARPKRWYKEQPNNVIEKYLGTEYAFYYKWLGLYTTMLVIPAACSLLVVIYGLSTKETLENKKSQEICESDILLCPKCPDCKYEFLKHTCSAAHTSYILNNIATTVFAVLISLWSAVLVEMWKRIEATHQMKWNVKNLEQDLSMRMEYKEKAHYREVADGTLEPFVPVTSWILKTTVTLLTIILTATIIGVVTVCLRMARGQLFLFLESDSDDPYQAQSTKTYIYPHIIISLVIVFVMIIFQKIYYKLAFVIARFENPRTEMEFDNSYIFKCYILDLVNHYVPLIYTAFMMGIKYSHPAEKQDTFANKIFSELCICLGCTIEMAVLQFTIWLIRTIYRIIMKLVIPNITVKIKYLRIKNIIMNAPPLEQWEEDYLLNRTTKYLVVDEYLDTVIEYGFVTFFISAFPLAPLCAFLTNILHLRIDAFKTITLYQRPNARKVAKLVAWSKILQATTYFGIITNAAMIAFNSDFVPRLLYQYYMKESLENIVEFQLTRFRTENVYSSRNYKVQEEYCYYYGIRDENTYEYTLNHYWIHAIRFATLLGIEHFVFLIQGFLSYMIPDVPYSVKEEIAHQQKMKREQSMKDTETTFINKRKKVIRESERFVLIK